VKPPITSTRKTLLDRALLPTLLERDRRSWSLSGNAGDGENGVSRPGSWSPPAGVNLEQTSPTLSWMVEAARHPSMGRGCRKR